MADEGQGTPQGPGSGDTLPPGRTRRMSNREPAVIEGRAKDVSSPVVSTAPNPPPEEQVASDTPGVSLESADAPALDETPHVPPPEGPVTDAPMPVEPAALRADGTTTSDRPGQSAGETGAAAASRKGLGLIYATAAVAVALGAGATWLLATDDGLAVATQLGLVGATPTQTAKPTNTTVQPPVAMSRTSSPPPASPMGTSSPSQTMVATTSPSASQVSPPPPARADAAVTTPAPAASPFVPATLPNADPRSTEIDRRITALDSRIGALSAAPMKPSPEISAALGAQDTRLQSMERTLAGLDKRLAAIEAQLAPKAEARATQAPDVASRETDTSAARVVVAQSLLAAVTSGTAYRGPLNALRALGAEDASVAGISASADKGVPTVAALRESFAALRPKLRTQAKTDPDASWSDKFSARLASLVTIRPASERTGPSAEAVASRIDAALVRGDVVAAVTEARALSGGDALLVKDWLDAATKRADAEAGARALVASSLSALAKPKS